MSTNVVMPHMGESVVEGTIIAWLKKPGETIAEDDPLVEIETDKVNVEVPSPAAGVLLNVLAEEGDKVEIDQTIAVIGEAGEKVAEAPAKPTPAPKPQPKPAEAPKEKPQPPKREEPKAPEPAAKEPEVVAKAPEAATPKPSAPPPKIGSLGVLASPAIRRFARESGVDLADVQGTGRMNRITREDVEAFAAGTAAPKQPEAPPVEPKSEPETKETPKAVQPGSDEELVPLTSMRRAVAEHMVRSKREAPHVTTVAEVDMTEVAALRAQWKEKFAGDGVKLTFMAFILNAVARALKEFPDLNASWTDDGILVKYRINLGIAVAVEEGLVVPVIHDADGLSMLDLARAVQTLADRTRDGKISPADLKDGTFTITNPGVFGAVISTPIIHQPQAAILATGRIADTVAAVNGAIAIRKQMFLSLSYDHRIVDGATAVKFLQAVRGVLEKADFAEE